jgi:hypothetical protein
VEVSHLFFSAVERVEICKRRDGWDGFASCWWAGRWLFTGESVFLSDILVPSLTVILIFSGLHARWWFRRWRWELFLLDHICLFRGQRDAILY